MQQVQVCERIQQAYKIKKEVSCLHSVLPILSGQSRQARQHVPRLHLGILLADRNALHHRVLSIS